ncbi:hypothetical protein B0H16DRAFT_1482037 [Mycena metata]|uniref:Uncharacterized protein n=1 Tax=Mycena metata TaxID=1033252 RepID=A0AAD7GV24_9AGAR|nr:hypothetical protein B0H16DRAFT_1482037 [Mycena metata]
MPLQIGPTSGETDDGDLSSVACRCATAVSDIAENNVSHAAVCNLVEMAKDKEKLEKTVDEVGVHVLQQLNLMHERLKEKRSQLKVSREQSNKILSVVRQYEAVHKDLVATMTCAACLSVFDNPDIWCLLQWFGSVHRPLTATLDVLFASGIIERVIKALPGDASPYARFFWDDEDEEETGSEEEANGEAEMEE